VARRRRAAEAEDGSRRSSAADLRSFRFGRSAIFYEHIEGAIDVVRALHSARDIDAAFGEDQ
jgi:toxin ParE1/3/4